MLVAPTHPLLEASATAMTVKGQQRYGLPNEANVPVSLTLLLGPTNWRDTVTAASSSSVTLSADINEDEENLIGKYMIITGGTGAGQYRGCIGWNNTTKVWLVDGTWTTNPDVTSTIQIINETRGLWQPADTPTTLDRMQAPFSKGTPHTSFLYGDEYILYPIPDLSYYGLMYRYYVDLDRLDDAEDLFINLLREWRSLWIQGIAVKSMQRYDEDRYMSELSVYKAMLDLLTNQCARVVGGAFHDV